MSNESGFPRFGLTRREAVKLGSAFVVTTLTASAFLRGDPVQAREHEASPSKEIIICVGTPESFSEDYEHQLKMLDPKLVDYFAAKEELDEAHILNAGERTYVISPVDSRNKESRNYENCTGIAIVGTDKHTGKNISLLTHQSVAISTRHKDAFQEDLSESLRQFIDRCIPGTIDAVIFGGYVSDVQHSRAPSHTITDEYVASVRIIASVFQEIAGFDPIVAIGPSRKPTEAASVILDTENRRIYMLRPEQPSSFDDSGFPASAVQKQKNRWEE